MKKLIIEIEVTVNDDIYPGDIEDWISGHMDNISEEILEEMDINPEEVEVGLTTLGRIEAIK